MVRDFSESVTNFAGQHGSFSSCLSLRRALNGLASNGKYAAGHVVSPKHVVMTRRHLTATQTRGSIGPRSSRSALPGVGVAGLPSSGITTVALRITPDVGRGTS